MSRVPDRPLRVALAQIQPFARDVPANLALSAELVRRAGAEGAALIAFPELSLTGYELPYLAESPDGWFAPDDARLDLLRRTCREAAIAAVVGAALREADGTPRIADFIVFPDGGLQCWRKQHVHGSEAHVFRSGEAGEPFAVAGWQVSLAICFDAAFPTHAAAASARGADVYLATSLYWRGEERRVDLHFGARAMDNRMFSALANYAGTTGGIEAIGGSGVWRPNGDVARRADGAEPALVVVDLDPADLRPYRS